MSHVSLPRSGLAHAPGNGMAGRGRMLADLCALLPDVERKEVEQAAFELTQKFYEQVDHQMMGWGSSTAEDARAPGLRRVAR
jgi:hypothetical protein